MSDVSLSKRPGRIGATDCIHCGTPFEVSASEGEFCCAGCRYVFGLIRGQGLERYYDLKDKRSVPVGGGVFEKRDLRWVSELVQQAELAGGRDARLRLQLQGISCVGCVWLVERVATDAAGMLAARMLAEEGTLQLTWVPGSCKVLELVREIESFGYRFQSPDSTKKPVGKDLSLRLGICGALAMNAMLFAVPRYFGLEAGSWLDHLFGWVAFLIASLSMAVGASYFVVRSIQALRRGILHLDVPIALGVSLAYIGSVAAWIFRHEGAMFFDFVSVFCFLMLAGRWLQNRTVSFNQSLVQGAVALRNVTRLSGENDATEEVALDAACVGDRIRVDPGQMVPLAGMLETPQARLSLEWINGESEPRMVIGGFPVLSGAFNTGNEAVIIKVTQPWRGSLLHRLMQESSGERPRNVGLERFIRFYLQIILLLAVAGGVAWWSLSGDVWRTMQVVISLLVVSCPCAIGVALPLADEMAALRLRSKGVFVRAVDCWFRLCKVRQIVFDKTGTLSLEGLRLKNADVLGSLDAAGREALWFLTDRSLHPVSRCLRAAWLERWLRPPEVASGWLFDEVFGAGVEMRNGGDVWKLGRSSWAAENEDGAATVLGFNGKKIAAFELEEQVRPDAVREFRSLAQSGYEISILSGDHLNKVKKMARHLGLREDHARAECSPDDKAVWIQKLDRHDTLMVGDGANDSLAFESAWCRATPAVENGVLSNKADFYFAGESLAGIRWALETAQQRHRAVWRTQFFTISYNVVVVGMSLAGAMNPLLAAVLMPCSSMVSMGIVAVSFRVRSR